jgi:hypothetical protein
MKSKILYLLSIFLFFICSCHGQISQKSIFTTNEQKKEKDISQTIKNFYVSYASNVSNGFDVENDVLLKENMTTPELIAKIHRISAAVGSDPIIRAQDFNLEALSSFDVKHLEEDWYMVSYISTYNDKVIKIPIRVKNKDNKLQIDYITPEWNNSLYGDSLLCKQDTLQTIDSSSPMLFLKTFYATYTMQYCTMSLDLVNRLEVLREKFCTKKASDKIQKTRASEQGYDLLIDYYDFDKLWLPTLSFAHLNGDEYKVSYTKWQDMTTNIFVSVIKKNDMYVIDDIRVESDY